MNRVLFQLCFEYVKYYATMDLLISVDGIDAERLKLFRLMQDRCKKLESEIEQAIVENDLLNNMTKENEEVN